MSVATLICNIAMRLSRLGSMLACMCVVLVAGCSAPSVSSYRDMTPRFDPSEFFAGHTRGWGMFQKRSGEVVKRFVVDLNGHWEGERFILDEHFVYADGEKQQRTWTLTRTGTGLWSGSAADVVGSAAGEQAGNALHWDYVLHLPVDGTVYDVSMDDWMYLVDDTTLVNRTTMRKFGIELGQVTLFFRRGAP